LKACIDRAYSDFNRTLHQAAVERALGKLHHITPRLPLCDPA
jgi:hypothetical protein